MALAPRMSPTMTAGGLASHPYFRVIDAGLAEKSLVDVGGLHDR
jgi:hypothetical protein